MALVAPAFGCLVAAVARIWRHPDRLRAGVLVAAAGGAWLVGEWDNPQIGSALVFSIGLACFAVAPAVVLHLGLSGGRGRLGGAVAVLVVVAGYVVTLGIQGVLSAVVVDPASVGCLGCPDDLWSWGGIRWSGAGLDAFGVRAGLCWAVLAAVALLVPWLRAAVAGRIVESLRRLPALVFLGLTVASYGRSAGRGFLGAESVDRRLWVAQAVALAGVAAGLLAEVVRERRAGQALARVVVDLSGASPARSLRDALADRLGDPDLVLAFPVDHQARFVDECARPVVVVPVAGRVTTDLAYAGERLATLVHRPGVLADRETVDELVAAIHLGLDHERLQAEALAQVEELRASGVRLVETSDEERRRLERDLHDGAQQRLVGVALGLRLLATRVGESPALAEATQELQAAIEDLRTLARGLAPLVLSDAGLAAAARALAETRDLRIDVVTDRRFPAVVEATAYLLIDRASVASPAVFSATADDDELAVRVHVDGPAPDLGDLADRALTLGGELRDLPGSSGCDVVLVLPLLRSPTPARL